MQLDFCTCALSGTSFARQDPADIGILPSLDQSNLWVKAERRSSFSVDDFVVIEVGREDACSTPIIKTENSICVFLNGTTGI